MKCKFDIDMVAEILAGDDSQAKIGMLDELEFHLPEWDIFPAQMFLAGLDDGDSEVRLLTFSLLGCCPEKLTQCDLVKVLGLIEDRCEDVRHQIVEDVGRFAREIERETIKEVLPYLWHYERDVRETAIQVFSEIPQLFNQEMFLELAGIFANKSMEAREAIGEFLERNGQSFLISSD